MKNVIIAIIAVFVLQFIPHSVEAQNPNKTAEHEWKILFDESIEWYNFGFFENALRGFKRLLVKDRNNCNINFYIAMSYYYLRLRRLTHTMAIHTRKPRHLFFRCSISDSFI